MTVLDLAVAKLQDRGYRVEREAPIPTSEGTRYPDIVAWNPAHNISYNLDVQVVVDARCGDISHPHARKVSHYNKEEILQNVRERTGHRPIVSSITCSWRGVLAPATVNTWTQLGLSKRDLNILVARVLEGGCRLWREFRQTSGGPRPHLCTWAS